MWLFLVLAYPIIKNASYDSYTYDKKNVTYYDLLEINFTYDNNNFGFTYDEREETTHEN